MSEVQKDVGFESLVLESFENLYRIPEEIWQSGFIGDIFYDQMELLGDLGDGFSHFGDDIRVEKNVGFALAEGFGDLQGRTFDSWAQVELPDERKKFSQDRGLAFELIGERMLPPDWQVNPYHLDAILLFQLQNFGWGRPAVGDDLQIFEPEFLGILKSGFDSAEKKRSGVG